MATVKKFMYGVLILSVPAFAMSAFAAFVPPVFAAEAKMKPGGVLPVIIEGNVAGVYENGKWSRGEGEIYLDGKIIDWESDDIADLEKKVMAAGEAGKTVPVKMSRLQESRELVYFTPEGKTGEGVAGGAYLWYKGEASGVETGIAFDGYEPEPGTLVIGVAKGIDAVPAPTVRSADGKGYTFSCDYKGTRYSVTLKPLEVGGSEAARVTGKLSVGKRSWDIEWEENESVYWEGEELECGFFDLDGDGSLEFAINSPGSNGGVSLFHADAEKGPERLASIYTGEE
jgi:hypothetical protein